MIIGYWKDERVEKRGEQCKTGWGRKYKHREKWCLALMLL